jgi:hypothetical protein
MKKFDHAAVLQRIHQTGIRPLTLEEIQQINDHAAECAACRSELADLALLDTSLHATLHERWDHVPEPAYPNPENFDRMIEQVQRSARGMTFKRTWQTASTVIGIILLVILLTFGALLASKALPALQPLPGPAVSTPTFLLQTPLPQTPAPTRQTSRSSAHLADTACALAQTPAIEPSVWNFSGKVLPGSGQVQSGDFKFGLWLACDPGFSASANDRAKFSELEGLGIYYSWSYSGSDQHGTTIVYSGIEPSYQMSGTFGPTLSASISQSGSQGLSFPVRYPPDWSQANLRMRYVIKVQAPDGRLQGAELHFDLVNSTAGYTVQNLAAIPLPAEDLSDISTGIMLKPGYQLRPLDPLLAEMVSLTQKWSQTMGTGPGWVHLLTEMDNPNGGVQANGNPAPVWGQWDDWYLIDATGHRINAISRTLDRAGNEDHVTVLRNGFWDNLSDGSRQPDDPTFTMFDRWDDGVIETFAEWIRTGGKIIKSSKQDANDQEVVIFQVTQQNVRETATYAAQTGQLLERTLGRQTDGIQENGGYKIEERTTNLKQERVNSPPETILALLTRAAKPYSPSPSGVTPTPFGFDPARSTLMMNMIMGDDPSAPTYWYGDLKADGHLLGRVNFGATPGGWCDRSPDGSKITFSFEVNKSETSVISSLRWLELKDVSRVYDPIPLIHLATAITWGPDNRSLAFTGGTNDQDLALMVFDIQTGELRRVGKAGFGPLIWSPDGQFIAQVEDKSTNSYALAVYNVANRKEIYRGNWDSTSWQPDGNAPILAWGVNMPRNLTGFNRCVEPKSKSK